MARIYTKGVIDWATLKPIEAESEWFEYAGPIVEAKGSSKKGGGGSAPAPPDPAATSAAQQQSNQQTAAYNAALNRVNTFTPLGSQTYNQTGTDPTTGAPIYETRIDLSPEQQQLYNQQTQQDLALGDTAQGMLGQVRNAYGQAINTSGLSQLQGGYQGYGPQMGVDRSGLSDLYGANDLMGARQQTQDALYDMNTAYLDKNTARDEEGLRTRLANQGLVEGSEAYNNAMDQFGQGKEMAYRQARNQAIAGGGDEMSRLAGISQANRGQLYGEALSGGQFANQAAAQGTAQNAQAAQFGNNARAQGMQEMFALRNQPMNEFNALRGASQVQMPQFQPTANVTMNPTDTAGNAYRSYQGQVDIYNANMAARNANTQGMFNLGAAAIGSFSDRRLKHVIARIGEHKGLGVYRYRYLGTDVERVGVMADEVEKLFPAAVVQVGRYKAVNYGALV